jgi:hypothetical protein
MGSLVICWSIKECGKSFGGSAENDFLERVAVERLFGTYIDGTNAALVGNVDEAGGGIDGSGGADDEEGGGAIELAVDGVHVEWDFAEPDDVRADRGVAGFADGKVIWVFVEGPIGKVFVGASAAGLEEAAMHVVDAVGTGALVEVVYVLGAEIEAVA